MIDPVELRHLLHQNPELMYEEFKTTKILYENLYLVPSIKIHKPLETGLVVEYKVNEREYLLFRTDIDALPIEEKNDCAFKSTNNFMHACGHDVHSAILYGFILKVVERKINQNMIFVFQPAEEGGGGAEKVLNSGVLDSYNIKHAFALHVTDEYDFGTIASTSGELFASSVEIDIMVTGKSAHVAFPDKGIDSLKILRKILDEVDKIILDAEKPTLFGCGKISGGTVRNIIAETAIAECTLRTLSIEKSKEIINKFEVVSENLENETGAKIKINCNAFYAEVTVDKHLYLHCKNILGSKYNFIDCGLKLTAEDFGYFTKRYPSFMFWLGTYTNHRSGLHTPNFLPPDEIIEKGIEIYLTILDSFN